MVDFYYLRAILVYFGACISIFHCRQQGACYLGAQKFSCRIHTCIVLTITPPIVPKTEQFYVIKMLYFNRRDHSIEIGPVYLILQTQDLNIVVNSFVTSRPKAINLIYG